RHRPGDRDRAGGCAPGGLRQRPARHHLGLPLAGPGGDRAGSAAGGEDHARPLRGHGRAHPGAAPLRAAGDPGLRRGHRCARLPRLGGGRNPSGGAAVNRDHAPGRGLARMRALFAPPKSLAPRWLLALLALLAPLTAGAIDPDDLLPVDEAFVLRAVATGPDRIELEWRIADGYYLYRHRMGAEPVDAGFRADPGGLQLPAGVRHTDEFFGDVETYRGQVRGVLPGTANGRRTELKVRYQG